MHIGKKHQKIIRNGSRFESLISLVWALSWEWFSCSTQIWV